MRKTAVIAMLLLIAIAPMLAQTRAATAAPPAAAAKSIDPQKIRTHVKFLSSDLLEGRGTGQRGGDIAAEYIAAEFALYGLKPAGENGTFLQNVPLVGISTEPSTKVALLPQNGKKMDLRLGDDIVAMDESTSPSSDVDAGVVFVGYGITAPEYKWDDYKDADVKGKV